MQGADESSSLYFCLATEDEAELWLHSILRLQHASSHPASDVEAILQKAATCAATPSALPKVASAVLSPSLLHLRLMCLWKREWSRCRRWQPSPRARCTTTRTTYGPRVPSPAVRPHANGHAQHRLEAGARAPHSRPPRRPVVPVARRAAPAVCGGAPEAHARDHGGERETAA